jgi:hypothetical protein
MTTVSFYLITAYTPTFGQSELHLNVRDEPDRNLGRCGLNPPEGVRITELKVFSHLASEPCQIKWISLERLYATSHSLINRRRICCGPPCLRPTSRAQPEPFSGDITRKETPEKGGASRHRDTGSNSVGVAGRITCGITSIKENV